MRDLLSYTGSGQVPFVPESEATQEKARRWSAYVCPDCRFVFRVPRDHDGEGIICPSCRRMLKIPKEGDETAPLMAPLQRVGFSDDGNTPVLEKRTRSKRKKKQKEAEIPDWDVSSGKWKARKSGGRPLLKTFLIWSAGMAVILGGIVVIVNLTGPKADPLLPAEIPGQDQFDSLVQENPLILPEKELDDRVELPEVMKRSESEFLAEAEPLAKTFLEADHVDQIIPVVNDPSRVRPLILDSYPDGKIKPMGISKFNSSGKVSYKDSFAAVSILTPDYETKQLAFIDGEDGLKIDWESWVGWSEVPWLKMLEIKPKKPTLVRAMVKWVDYYNFGFSSEKDWRSYRLVSPDGETTLYGYVARNSLLDQRLRPGEPTATVAVTLKIRFRENEQAPNQVVIEEFVSDGWVVVPEKE